MKLPLFYFFFLFTYAASAQQWVNTNPENKRTLIEQFTGVQCAGCPDGADEVDQLLQLYPDKLCAVEYHQPYTLFCVPYGNDPDFRRNFLGAYASASFNFTGAYPTAFVHRRMWPGETHRNFYITTWQSRMLAINAEPSPLNIGLHPVYDMSTQTLTVDVEVYYTSTVTDPLTLYVQFSESGMIAMQKNGSVYDTNYVHHRVFREALCSQWGDQLSNTTQSTLFTTTYTYSNAANLYDMANCEVQVFVRNAANEEIVTVNSAAVYISTAIAETVSQEINVFPNPANDKVYIRLQEFSSHDDCLKIFDAIGKEIFSQKIIEQEFSVDLSRYKAGLYTLQIVNGSSISSKLIVVE